MNRRDPGPAPVSLVLMPGGDRGAALASIRAQAVPPLEVFLEDPPASHLDGTCLRPLGRGGGAQVLGVALLAARGDWLQVLAPGARLLPQACQRAMGQVQAHPQVGLFLADAVLVPPAGDRVLAALDWRAAAGTFDGMELAELRCHGPEWPQDPALLNVARLREAGGFRPELEWHALWWATHLLGFRYGATYLREVLVERAAAAPVEPGAEVWSLAHPPLHALLCLAAVQEQADLAAPLALSGALGAFGQDLAEVYLADPSLWREGLSLALGPCLAAHRRREPQFLGRAGAAQADRDLDARVAAQIRSILVQDGGGVEPPA